MNHIFKDKFFKTPKVVIDDVFYYDSKDVGDQFLEEEVKEWSKNGVFQKIYSNGRTSRNNDIFIKLANQVVEINLPYMEISCGPGLGLTPFIKNIKPSIPSLITDACPYIVKYWNKYIRDNNIESNMSFASFDNCNMPLKSESIDVITSYLGIGSTRFDGPDNMNCISEIYRVLKHDGYLITIENELDDYDAVDDIFNTANKYNYYKNPKVIGDLKERLEKAGFTIIELIDLGKELIGQDDSELGELAYMQGKEIYWAEKAFIVKK
ncbi:MAG: methyltransferase domain-containing protein [Candidatus Caldatribacteriota bacterium]